MVLHRLGYKAINCAQKKCEPPSYVYIYDIYIYIHVHSHICVHIYIYIHTFIHMSKYVYLYICIPYPFGLKHLAQELWEVVLGLAVGSVALRSLRPFGRLRCPALPRRELAVQ